MINFEEDKLKTIKGKCKCSAEYMTYMSYHEKHKGIEVQHVTCFCGEKLLLPTTDKSFGIEMVKFIWDDNEYIYRNFNKDEIPSWGVNLAICTS